MSKRTKKSIPKKLRELVHDRAKGQCEYCLKFEQFSRTLFHIDHIIAEQHGGQTIESNLAYSCSFCNGFKGTNLVTIVPGVKEYVSLFNPRKNSWSNHFSLDRSGLISGKTLEGRATIELLKFNTVENVITRSHMLRAGILKPIS